MHAGKGNSHPHRARALKLLRTGIPRRSHAHTRITGIALSLVGRKQKQSHATLRTCNHVRDF